MKGCADLADVITAEKSKGEILVYQRGRMPVEVKRKHDVESGSKEAAQSGSTSDGAKEVNIQRQTSIVSWKDVVYDIKIKGQDRRILDHIDGWVKPGTLTALMVSFPFGEQLGVVYADMQGRFWSWQDHTAGRSSYPRYYGSRRRARLGRWSTERRVLPEKNGLRPAARCASRDMYYPRGPRILGPTPPAGTSVEGGKTRLCG